MLRAGDYEPRAVSAFRHLLFFDYPHDTGDADPSAVHHPVQPFFVIGVRLAAQNDKDTASPPAEVGDLPQKPMKFSVGVEVMFEFDQDVVTDKNVGPRTADGELLCHLNIP